MDHEHEVVVPREGMPFKIDIFEGCSGNYTREAHWHNSVEIFAVYEGSLEFLFRNRKSVIVPAGCFVIINPNELHSIHAAERNDSIYLQIPLSAFEHYLTADHFISFRKRKPGGEKDDRFRADRELDEREWEDIGTLQEQQMLDLMRNVYEKGKEKPTGYEYEMLRDFYQIMYLLVNTYRQEEPDAKQYQSSKALQRLSPITEYMKKHYAEELSLHSLAAQFGYSPEHLSRMFQKYAFMNYKYYLSSIRLEHAMEEMQTGEKTLSEIAVSVGFSDSRAMAKAFVKHFGMLPSEYLKISKK